MTREFLKDLAIDLALTLTIGGIVYATLYIYGIAIDEVIAQITYEVLSFP